MSHYDLMAENGFDDDDVTPINMEGTLSKKSLSKIKRGSRDNKLLIMSQESPKINITPLSKAEECAMRKMRRKLKNKISAQESRRRKKEYVDNLEKRVSLLDGENELLRKTLEERDQSLRSLTYQVGKIQRRVSYENKGTQTGICLKCYLRRQSSENGDFKVKTGKNGRIIVSSDFENGKLYHKTNYTELRNLFVENVSHDGVEHEKYSAKDNIYSPPHLH